PLEFKNDASWESVKINGDEVFSLKGVEGDLTPHQEVQLVIQHQGQTREVPLLLRLDTPIEVEYYLHGGIMPYVLRQIIKR
ncbi:MAG: hypothetical protein KBA81_07670, partial [Rhabdochlamydiaceae bacterium]|nr:hypothetical protein [Rhabdochlamydiaceae bacterium]